MKSLIIFDFDGVLADSFDAFYSLIKDAMNHIGLALTPDQYQDFFLGNVYKGFENFIGDEKKYLSFMDFRNSNFDKYYNTDFFPKTLKFLKKISKNNILSIASSGRVSNIIGLLEQNHVKNLFSLIVANSTDSKTGTIKKILHKFSAIPGETTFVTDTVGDIKAAKECGLKTIAVTWGFHNRTTLETAQPDFIVSTFEELSKILN